MEGITDLLVHFKEILEWHRANHQQERIARIFDGLVVMAVCLGGFEIAQCSETLDEGGHWLGPLDSASLAH